MTIVQPMSECRSFGMELGLVENYGYHVKEARFYSFGNAVLTEIRSGVWMIRFIF